MPRELNKAVFLDRDGTIIVDTNFSVDPARLAPMPGTLEGLRRLQEAGYLLVVITNQSGVARGRFEEPQLVAFHEHMIGWFAARGITLTAIYYCPHYAGGEVAPYAVSCDCRKPAAGMLRRAAEEHRIDLAQSWMIGDRDCDIGVGRAAGCRTIRVHRSDDGRVTSDFEVADVAQAADLILGRLPQRG